MKISIIIILLALIYFVLIKDNSRQTRKYPNTDKEISEHISAIDTAWVHINIDNFNEIITITGVVGNQNELDDIISNIVNSYHQLNLQHDISIDDSLSSRDFAINIAVVTATIQAVQQAEVIYNKKEIIIKGLVRNKTIESKIVSQLREAFNNQIKISNQLIQVIEDNNEIPLLEIPLAKMPEL